MAEVTTIYIPNFAPGAAGLVPAPQYPAAGQILTDTGWKTPAPSAFTDTTNASNITSGTLNPALLMSTALLLAAIMGTN